MTHGTKKRRRSKQDERDAARTWLKAVRNEEQHGPPADLLRDLVSRLRSPGRELAWLAAYDLDPALSKEAEILLFTALQSPLVPENVRDGFRTAARPVLLEALQDMAVPDDRKLMLGTFHHLAGGTMSEEEHARCFQDFDAAVGQLAQRTSEVFSDHPQAVESTLEAMEILVDGECKLQQDSLASSIEPYMGFCSKVPDAIAAVSVSVMTASLAANLSASKVTCSDCALCASSLPP